MYHVGIVGLTGIAASGGGKVEGPLAQPMPGSHAAAFAALPQTQVVDGKLARVLTWYDNEWGFATRMADTALVMSKLI